MIPMIERDGRYFLQFENGEELERTPEQMRLLKEALEAKGKAIEDQMATMESKFKRSGLGSGKLPVKAHAYLYIENVMQAMKQLCQHDFDKGTSLEYCSKMCEMSISKLKMERAVPTADKNIINYFIAGWKDIRRFTALFPTTSERETEATAHPWAKIDALAEQIGLRKSGGFTPASNRIKVAVAGFIDALHDAGTVPTTDTLPQLYAAFSAHYGRKVGADRSSNTRTYWHQKGREALGLPDLKPRKLSPKSPN